MSKEEHTRDVETVIRAEQEHIKIGRKESGMAADTEGFCGLAISGGGIRSASFSLGILQSLVNGGLMKKLDYMSTASGGGYLGAALTWFLNQGLPDGRPAGTEPENFPFGKVGQGARNQADTRNSILDFLRQHGYYLTPGNGLDGASIAGYALRTIFLSLLVYFSLLTLVMSGIRSIDALFQPYPILDVLHADGSPLQLPNLFFLAAVVLLAFFVISGIVYSLCSRIRLGSAAFWYKLRVYNQIGISIMLKLMVIALVLGSLSVVYGLLLQAKMHIHAAGASTLLGAAMTWYKYAQQQRAAKSAGSNKDNKDNKDITSILAAFLIIYGMLLGAFILAEILLNKAPVTSDLSFVTQIIAFAVLAAIAFIIGFCVNINYFSLHRMYRDRLMETFMPDLENVNSNTWGPAIKADQALLENMCQSPNRRPYHIINTNLVLVNSATAKYRGRGGDCFTLAPLYCGSDATGWRTSSSYMKKGGRGMTLSTAMAISGAALNPNAANNGRGLSRNRWISILYSLLNLRLGYWAVNPERKGAWWLIPNFIKPALTQSILGKGLSENKAMIELSDGGHFENLGIYELIRRKLKVIVACDGGADPNFTFDDLANAIERVRVDFGAKIVFDHDGFGLCWVCPGSADKSCDADPYKAAKRGFAVASIYYADGSKGLLLYIKATITHGLSADVYSYKAANPTFPHQATLDQFFDEVQIESYRELGYYFGWQLLEANSSVMPGQKFTLQNKPQWI